MNEKVYVVVSKQSKDIVSPRFEIKIEAELWLSKWIEESLGENIDRNNYRIERVFT